MGVPSMVMEKELVAEIKPVAELETAKRSKYNKLSVACEEAAHIKKSGKDDQLEYNSMDGNEDVLSSVFVPSPVTTAIENSEVGTISKGGKCDPRPPHDYKTLCELI